MSVWLGQIILLFVNNFETIAWLNSQFNVRFLRLNRLQSDFRLLRFLSDLNLDRWLCRFSGSDSNRCRFIRCWHIELCLNSVQRLENIINFRTTHLTTGLCLATCQQCFELIQHEGHVFVSIGKSSCLLCLCFLSFLLSLLIFLGQTGSIHEDFSGGGFAVTGFFNVELD